jgi:uncharacterized protein
MKTAMLSMPLTERELADLDEVLGTVGSHSMSVHELDGFLCALVAGPETVLPSEFLPLVWERTEEHEGAFADEATATETVHRILRHMNVIIAAVEEGGIYEPLLDRYDDRPGPVGQVWAQGFMRGVRLRRQAWAPLIRDDAQGGLLLTIATVAGEVDPAWLTKPRNQEENDRILVDLAAGFLHAYRYFQLSRKTARAATPISRGTPKVGRNAPCPCGSGRKFKHCCEPSSGGTSS